MSGHCFGNVLPAGESVAFDSRRFGKIDNSAVVNTHSLELNTVNQEENFVTVHSVCAFDNDVMGRHSAGIFLPACEGITLFLGSLGSCNGSVVLDSLCLEYLAVKFEHSLIRVDAEATGHHNVAGGHDLREIFPAAESITLFLGNTFRFGNFITISHL